MLQFCTSITSKMNLLKYSLVLLLATLSIVNGAVPLVAAGAAAFSIGTAIDYYKTAMAFIMPAVTLLKKNEEIDYRKQLDEISSKVRKLN